MVRIGRPPGGWRSWTFTNSMNLTFREVDLPTDLKRTILRSFAK